MKSATIFAAALATAGSALAQQQYYNLVASAPGESFDGVALTASGRFFHINTASDSSCGADASPAVAIIDDSLVIYNDGTSHQQAVFVDISGASDGLLAYTPAGTPGGLPGGFTLMGAEADQIYVYYEGTESADNKFLACESGDAAGEYYVYPEKAYGKSVGEDACIQFQLRAAEVEKPTSTCTFN